MKLVVIEPNILIGDDIMASLKAEFEPTECVLGTSLKTAAQDITMLTHGDLLVVSTTAEDLRNHGLLERMNKLPFALLVLNTDEKATPRHQDPWHRIPKPFSDRMLIQAANAAFVKRTQKFAS